MAKARVLAVLVISLLILAAFSPGPVLAGTVDQPSDVNRSPAGSADNISLTPTLQSSVFTGSVGTTHAASQWQITTSTSGNYANPYLVFDSGFSGDDLVTIDIPVWTLSPNTTYYWHVRYQNNLGDQSVWSATTSFTTIAYAAPARPENRSPVNDAIDTNLTPTLYSSGFSAVNVPNPGNPVSHAASRWQIAAGAGKDSTTGDFVGPLFDSDIDTSNKTEIAVTSGLLTYGTTYYWHVKYQDVYGKWSDWSSETSFTTLANVAPNAPSNTAPVEEASAVSLTPILGASAFSDLNEGDTHAASRWQVRLDTGTYDTDSVVYDSDNVTTNLSSITVPSGKLSSGKTYYWHVKYQDNYDHWSGWSAETSFDTRELSVPVAVFGASATSVVAGQDMVTFTDNSTGDIDSWTWNFGDGTTKTWSAATRPSEGTVLHTYTDGGAYTVSLTVTNDAGNGVETKTGYVTVHAIPKAVFSSGVATDQVVQFTDSSTGEITSWKWSFGDDTAEEWTIRPADGKISHTYDKAGTYVVSLEVTGALGTHTLNKPVEVSGGGGGFHFGWWMVGVILAALVVIGGVVFLVMKRRK